MRIGIFYYSGTGSNAYLAKYIMGKFLDFGHEVEIFRYTIESIENYEKYDLIGIGSPVWMWRAPRFLTQRLISKGFSNKTYFIFNACAGSSVNAPWSIYRALKGKNNNFLGNLIGKGTNNIRRYVIWKVFR